MKPSDLSWDAIYWLYEMMIFLVLVGLLTWQMEKRRRMKFLWKMTVTDSRFTNENARALLKEYKIKIERLQFHNGTRGNHLGFVFGVPWAILAVVLGQMFAIYGVAYDPMLYFVLFTFLYIGLYMRWVLGLIG